MIDSNEYENEMKVGFGVIIFVMAQTYMVGFNYYLTKLFDFTAIFYILPILMETYFLAWIKSNAKNMGDMFLYHIFLSSLVNYIYMFVCCLLYDNGRITKDSLHQVQGVTDNIEYALGVIVLVICFTKLIKLRNPI